MAKGSASVSAGTTLYRFFDAAGRLLYVGITDRGPRRWREHMVTQPWWDDVASSTIEHVGDRVAAEEAERIAIQTEKPLHNVVYAVPASQPVRRSHTCPAARRQPFSDYLAREDPALARWATSWFAPLDMGWEHISASLAIVPTAAPGVVRAFSDVYFKWIVSSYSDDEWGIGAWIYDCCPRCSNRDKRPEGYEPENYCRCRHVPVNAAEICSEGRREAFYQCGCCSLVWSCYWGNCWDAELDAIERWTRPDGFCDGVLWTIPRLQAANTAELGGAAR